MEVMKSVDIESFLKYIPISETKLPTLSKTNMLIKEKRPHGAEKMPETTV